MSKIRLILAVHNHQPVGNFGNVFEIAHRDGYDPFLDVMENYPEIPFALHLSGPLLEWLEHNRPRYLDRVRAFVKAGRTELLGGALQEPILTMLPYRDRVGQIRAASKYIHDLFDVRVRGMWMAERVWEPHLVTSLAEAGIEFTLLDDDHFQRAGVFGGDLQGYYLTEDEGRMLKIFPGDEKLRYLIPFDSPESVIEHLLFMADRRPDSLAVFGDDGEKFGVWPETHQHVYKNGWLRRFLDLLKDHRDRIEVITFAHALETALPLGKIYLPESSYREMTEWVLHSSRQEEFALAQRNVSEHDQYEQFRTFFRAGGFWRNFKIKYSEADEMYARMLTVSKRLENARAHPEADPDFLEIAEAELYRGQCNCAYWHGAFGGLYLPHLRNAIYNHLIGADNALDDALEKTEERIGLEVGDWNLDGRQEVRLENDLMVAFLAPARGGHLYELDVRRTQTNLLATLNRRPEPYHGKVRAAAIAAREPVNETGPNETSTDEVNNLHNKVILKHDSLDQSLIYDDYPRKALVDHCYLPDVTIDQLIQGTAAEIGDFVQGTYLTRVHREENLASLVMERPGRVHDRMITLRKTVTLEAGSDTLVVMYELRDFAPGDPFVFAVEWNVAAMAGHASDRYFADEEGQNLGMLDTVLDLPTCSGITLGDQWQELAVRLRWSVPGGVWCLPIETVSQSEGGFEKVFQSASVTPHWLIDPQKISAFTVELHCRLGDFSLVNPG